MTTLDVIHLINDSTPGGVMHVLDHLSAQHDLNCNMRHEIRQIKRGSLSAPRLAGDLIVSHLAISWRALPFLMQLRALNAHIPMLHVEHSYTAGFVAHNVRQNCAFTRFCGPPTRFLTRSQPSAPRSATGWPHAGWSMAQGWSFCARQWM